jgi:hypothetical protein
MPYKHLRYIRDDQYPAKKSVTEGGGPFHFSADLSVTNVVSHRFRCTMQADLRAPEFAYARLLKALRTVPVAALWPLWLAFSSWEAAP